MKKVKGKKLKIKIIDPQGFPNITTIVKIDDMTWIDQKYDNKFVDTYNELDKLASGEIHQNTECSDLHFFINTPIGNIFINKIMFVSFK